jgi:HSP20 family protein
MKVHYSGGYFMKPVLTHNKTEIALQPQSSSAFMQEISELFNKIEKRAYELFEWRGREDGHDLDDWFNAETELFRQIPLEIREKENRLIIRAEVPGFTAEELEISLEPALLTVTGKHQQETEKKQEKSVHSEIREKEIFRHIVLPMNVIPDNATATLNNGVLEITAPRAVEAKKIKVAAA